MAIAPTVTKEEVGTVGMLDKQKLSLVSRALYT